MQRGGRVLAGAITLSARPGDAWIIRGPNGSGKTSLLRAIAGFSPPAQGRVALEEAGRARPAAEVAAYVGHAEGLRSQETPRAHLAFFLRWAGGDVGAADETLARVGLERHADKPARTLSAGQRRRVTLARLWTGGRPLWLLDEPTAALDDAGRALLSDLVAAHRVAGGVVMAAVHGALEWPDVRQLRLTPQASTPEPHERAP